MRIRNRRGLTLAWTEDAQEMALLAEVRSAASDTVQPLARDERNMRLVEWLVASVALLASLALSLPR